MKQIVELYISDCNSLTSLPFSVLPSSLKRIEISECQKLKFTTTSYQQLQEIGEWPKGVAFTETPLYNRASDRP
ncbi:hypothetical protein H5410_001464 [Solanum commersonii]|uniref:Disease resistance protein n=1 Tax=Solanum commersonii TaxID=4109 RepID=A0A9J6AZS4_SOLCO|nr:hypothetical protein H5410_001464 [Solanum commersonii]